jgi:hypothetical protein
VYLNVNHSRLHTQDYTLCQTYFGLYSCMNCVHIYFQNTLIILCSFWCKLWCNILIFIKISSQWHWKVPYLLSMRNPSFFWWENEQINTIHNIFYIYILQFLLFLIFFHMIQVVTMESEFIQYKRVGGNWQMVDKRREEGCR